MHIWVGIDGSTASERALEWAVRFAAGRSDIVKTGELLVVPGSSADHRYGTSFGPCDG